MCTATADRAGKLSLRHEGVADMMRRGDMPDREIELMKRIETEHTIFKYRMLASPAAEVYENCNVIRFYECIYEFFQYAENIEKEYINACLMYENVKIGRAHV